MTQDGIFEPSEFWVFVVQDYQGAGSVGAIDSIGVVSTAGPSTGSIIAIPTSAPGNPVGGELIPIETTSLILAGTQMTAAWMIPVLVSAVGIGLVVFRKNNS